MDFDSAAEDGFRNYVRGHNLTVIPIYAGLLAVLSPLFIFLDYYLIGRHLRELLVLRIFLEATALAFWLLCRKRPDIVRRHDIVLGLLLALCVVWSIEVMVFLHTGYSSPYYAGICLGTIAAGFLYLVPRNAAVTFHVLVYAPFIAPAVFRIVPIDDLKLFFTHNLFLLSTIFIVFISQIVRFRLEHRAFESNVQVQKANSDLQRLNEDLARLSQQKEQMFQNVSHELRTPLTLILSPVESMLETPDRPADDVKRLHSVQRNALRMVSLVNDMLDLAKLSEVGLDVRQVTLNVGATIAKIAQDIEHVAQQKGLELRVDVPDSGPYYSLDADHFEKIVLNLVGNALKFTQAGSVGLAAYEREDGVHVVVDDSGPGIAKHLQEEVFQRFGQGDGSRTRRYGGTGIGLALVAELASLMDGKVLLESELGKGTRVVVTFPRCHKVELVEQLPRAVISEAAAEATLSRRAALSVLDASDERAPETRRVGKYGPLVLIAEDEPELNAELVDLLSAEHRVISVRDGDEALRAAIEHEPDVIVTDVMMPKLDGLALASKIRERLELRNTPLILLTARCHVDDRVSGREIGVDTYLTKPFHPRELLAAVRGVLKSRMRVIGSFLLRERLGGGGQAEVFLAEHVRSGALAALKILRDVSVDESTREAVRREQRALSIVRHPNVPEILEQGELEESFYVAMEHISGKTVTELVREHGRLDPGSVTEIGIGVANALDALHAAAFIHRDVKCSNIMLETSRSRTREAVRLIDFGIAIGESVTHTKIAGTLPYLAPEVVDGDRPSPQSDIYALGVSMFQMATGGLPYRALDTRNLASVLHLSAPRRVCVLRPDFPPQLDDIIQRAMAKYPRQRFESAAALSQALEALDVGPREIESTLSRTGTLSAVGDRRSQNLVTP